LKATYLHYFVVIEQIVVFMVDLGQNHVHVLLLTIELETLAPSWAIFDALAHPIYVPTWEKWVVLD
jgi:hypothetical protein